MAKVVVELDTEKNTLVANIDGKAISDIDYVSFSRYCNCHSNTENLSFSLTQKVAKEDTGVNTYTSYSWYTPDKCCVARASEITVEKKVGNLEKSIASLFK